MKSNSKNIILLIVIVVIIIATIISYSFAYFQTPTDIQNNIPINITIAEGIVANMYVDNINNLEFSISENMGELSVGNFIEDVALMNINLDSLTPLTCTYDLYWIWDDNSSEYCITTTAGDCCQKATQTLTNKCLKDNKELTITGTDLTDNQTVDEVQLNYNSTFKSNGETITGQKLGTYEIYTAGGGEVATQDWEFIARFYNRDINQDEHVGNNYSGRIEVRNAVCDV